MRLRPSAFALLPFRRRASERRDPLDPQSAYALWAPTYAPEPHNRLMEIEQQTVLSLLPDVRGHAAIDAGCGSGRYVRELTARGAWVAGVDLSQPMLARARTIGGALVRANLCALPVDSMAVDTIVCGLALGDVPHLELALSEMARVLRPGGCLIYSVVHPAGQRAGWTRTFDAGGRRLAIDGYWHSLDDHRRACAAAGLMVTAWEEPFLDEVPECPAVLVVRANARHEPRAEPS
jgi:malonyl-CoA O-methyltransferase